MTRLTTLILCMLGLWGSISCSGSTTQATDTLADSAGDMLSPTDSVDVSGTDGVSPQDSLADQQGDQSLSDGATPSWVPQNTNDGPWKGQVKIATSADGLTFTGNTLLFDHAGVPHLALTKTGQLIATIQYFSYDKESEFNIIAYATSDDSGANWTTLKPIVLSGIPKSGPPVDPTLVQLDDGSLRLYFTLHLDGQARAGLASAKAPTIAGPFAYEGVHLTLTDANLLDPAVVKLGSTWHYFTPKPGTTDKSLHGTSPDGTTFTWQPEITLSMQMLGSAVIVDGKIRFYGTGPGGVLSALSADGLAWTMDPGVRMAGGVDPGVARLSNGQYIMLYTVLPPK